MGGGDSEVVDRPASILGLVTADTGGGGDADNDPALLPASVGLGLVAATVDPPPVTSA